MKRFLLPLSLVITMLICVPGRSLAVEEDNKLVEINYPIEVTRPYKERRRRHGANVAIRWEQFKPSNWDSLSYYVDENIDTTYAEIYGDAPIPLLSAEGGYKYNFFLGSISLLAGGSYGSLTSTYYEMDHSINIVKYYAKAMYIIDAIMPEPYLAPYVAGSVWKMEIEESVVDTDVGGSLTTGFGFEYSVGALIQLNWIEAELAKESLNSTGLENTYLDLFITQHMRSMTADDPSLATNLSYGAGLRLEF